MHVPGIPAIALALLLCVLASGCTSELSDELLATPTPVHTLAAIPATIHTTAPPAVTAIPATAPTMATMERLQALPSERKINLVLTKDRPTSEIHLLYQGGPGDLYLNRVMMRVYTSDTEYREYIMSNGKKPIPGDEIIAPGTRSGDRCEVFVISAGTRFRVMDERVYGGMYY